MGGGFKWAPAGTSFLVLGALQRDTEDKTDSQPAAVKSTQDETEQLKPPYVSYVSYTSVPSGSQCLQTWTRERLYSPLVKYR